MNLNEINMKFKKDDSFEPSEKDKIQEVFMDQEAGVYGSLMKIGAEKTSEPNEEGLTEPDEKKGRRIQDFKTKGKAQTVLNANFIPIKSPSDHRNFRKVSTIQMIEESFKFVPKPHAPIPQLPRKQLFMSFCLLIVGLILLIAGTVTAIKSNKASNGVAFWVIGAICGLPGLFYAFKFCQVCYAKSGEIKRKALEEIPQE